MTHTSVAGHFEAAERVHSLARLAVDAAAHGSSHRAAELLSQMDDALHAALSAAEAERDRLREALQQRKDAEDKYAPTLPQPDAAAHADVVLPDTIRELQALRSRIDLRLHFLVCGDPTKWVTLPYLDAPLPASGDAALSAPKGDAT